MGVKMMTFGAELDDEDGGREVAVEGLISNNFYEGGRGGKV